MAQRKYPCTLKKQGIGIVKVEFSDSFAEQFLHFDDDVRDVIVEFAIYVEHHGLKGLQGRNKSSALANPHTKRQQAQFAYAQKHCLWHYHIGIPHYIGEHGDMTSEYILHYQRFDDGIVIVDMTAHPPFELPALKD